MEKRQPLYPEIFLISLGGLLLEIAYTRIFSFKVFYYFTYLILGTGLLGIGAGGIVVAVSERLRKVALERVVAAASFAGATSVLLSYAIIAKVQLNVAEALDQPAEIAKLVFVSLLLTGSFFAVGISISSILSRDPAHASRLYGSDLLGAALGAALAVPLLTAIGPPRTAFLAAAIIGVSGVRHAGPRLRVAAGAVLAALLVLVAFESIVPDPVVAKTKSLEDFRRDKVVQFSRWSPVFRIDVSATPFDPNTRLVFHDGQPGSGMHRFDGVHFENFDYLRRDPRSLPFSVAPKAPRVLIIGAAGGHEIVASLMFGASHVTGVELNPVTYSLLTTHYADFTGHLAENPKVTLVNGDGRWFLKQSREVYDLVWFVAPDSYAAMNAATSGAFVLSESYLYTKEMVRDSLEHLSPDGIICAQFGELDFARKPNRTTRYASTARAAFTEGGLTPFSDHILVASSPGFPPFLELAVLLGRSPFKPPQVQAFGHAVEQIHDALVQFVPGTPGGSRVADAITVPDAQLPAFLAKLPYQVDAVTDDVPFFWHFTRFRDALGTPQVRDSVIVDQEDSVAERVTMSFLGIVGVLSAILLFLPLLTMQKTWARMPRKLSACIYFAALGLGFMLLEVTLIQKLTLLLGYPTRSLSVTLSALLVFSGLGSLLSPRLSLGSRKRNLLALFAALSIVVLAVRAFLPSLVDTFVGASLAVRVLLTLLVIAPIGLCLGGFMPLGLAAIAGSMEDSREYVAWAWAVNGFFSVIASIVSTILAMIMGFRALFLVALGVYLLGTLALLAFPEEESRRPS